MSKTEVDRRVSSLISSYQIRTDMSGVQIGREDRNFGKLLSAFGRDFVEAIKSEFLDPEDDYDR